MEMLLRDYLGGHVLRTAILRFEDAMGPWVKEQVQTYFHGLHPTWATDDARAAAEHAAATDAAKAELARLDERHAVLDRLMRGCPKAKKQALAREKYAAKQHLKAFSAKAVDPPPVPHWVEECRDCVGRLMKPRVLASNHWGVYTIVAVMRALLPEVFAHHFPDHFHAKECLDGILRVVFIRAKVGHGDSLVESDVLEALRHMGAVLTRCGHDDGGGSAASVMAFLDDVERLVQQAREGGGRATCAGPPLRLNDATAQQLYTTISAWELQVEKLLGLVAVAADGVVTSTGTGSLSYRYGTVAFGQNLDRKWSVIVKKLLPQFKIIAMARHWYFHKDSDNCDVSAAFVAMDVVVTALNSATNAANAAELLAAELWLAEVTQPCPGCSQLCQKDGGSSTVQCLCGERFQYASRDGVAAPAAAAEQTDGYKIGWTTPAVITTLVSPTTLQLELPVVVRLPLGHSLGSVERGTTRTLVDPVRDCFNAKMSTRTTECGGRDDTAQMPLDFQATCTGVSPCVKMLAQVFRCCGVDSPLFMLSNFLACVSCPHVFICAYSYRRGG